MFKKEIITSFSYIRLTISAMRFKEEYEILPRGDKAVITQYSLSYIDEESRKPEKSCKCPLEEVISLLNECRILKWDKFSGKNPPGVRDGYMFNFKAAVNDDRKISADGSNNYPRNYHQLLKYMRDKLNP